MMHQDKLPTNTETEKSPEASLEMYAYVQAIPSSGKEQSGSVTNFICYPDDQFDPETTDSEIREELMESENYPSLIKGLRSNGLSPQKIIDIVQSGQAASLVELESLASDFLWKQENIENFCGDFLQNLISRESLTTFASVEQLDTGTTICIAAAFKDDKTAEQDILNVAEYGLPEFPFGAAPDTHGIISLNPVNLPDCFISLIVNNQPESESSTVVAAVLHPSTDSYRDYVAIQLHKLADLKGFEAVRMWRDEINATFKLLGIKEFEMSEFLPPKNNSDNLVTPNSDPVLKARNFIDIQVQSDSSSSEPALYAYGSKPGTPYNTGSIEFLERTKAPVPEDTSLPLDILFSDSFGALIPFNEC